jgi:hypothetical protein
MMKISQLFTVSGLTQALKAHHDHLHANYSFPPLKGNKPLHKLAELFEHKSAEPFIAELKAFESNHMTASVNLSNSSRSQIVHVMIDEDEGEHKVRVMFNCEPQFLICDINPTDIAPAIIYYENSKGATVFFGAIAVRLIMESDCVIATLLEKDDGISFDNYNMPFVGQNISQRDEQSEMFEKENLPLFDNDWVTDTDRDELMESFDEAMSKIPFKHLIAAKVSSDDGNINIEFNALDYFESELANGNIETVTEALDGCDFGSDYPTDTIAEYFSDTTTERLFNYLENINEDKVRETLMGFDCVINSEHFFTWLQTKGTKSLSQKSTPLITEDLGSQEGGTITEISNKFIEDFSFITEDTEFYLSSNISGKVSPLGEVDLNYCGTHHYHLFCIEDFLKLNFHGNKDVPHLFSQHIGNRDESGQLVFLKGFNKLSEIDDNEDGSQIFSKPIAVNCIPAALSITKRNNEHDVSIHQCKAAAIIHLKNEVLDDVNAISSAKEMLENSHYGSTYELSEETAENEWIKVIKEASFSELVDFMNFLHESVFVSIETYSSC